MTEASGFRCVLRCTDGVLSLDGVTGGTQGGGCALF